MNIRDGCNKQADYYMRLDLLDQFSFAWRTRLDVDFIPVGVMCSDDIDDRQYSGYRRHVNDFSIIQSWTDSA